MAKKPIKYLQNNLEQPKQKASFFEKAVRRTKAYVTMDFNIAYIVKVKDNDGNVMTFKDTGKAIDAKDKHGNKLLDVKNPTYDLIGKSYLNNDKTINVKKALNPFRAVDKKIVSIRPIRSKIGAMIVKGVVQDFVLPLELPVKALKNVTDTGINSVINTVKKLQASRKQKDVVTKNDVLGQNKKIQGPQQESSIPEIATIAPKSKPVLPISVAELGHGAAVQHIHAQLTHNNKLPPSLPKNPPVGIGTPQVKPVLKRGQSNGQGR